MSKMGLMVFTNFGDMTDVVAPRSDYDTAEDFLIAALDECDGYEIEDKLTIEAVREDYCRWYPEAPEDVGVDGPCYAFSQPGKGAFAVWRIDLQ